MSKRKRKNWYESDDEFDQEDDSIGFSRHTSYKTNYYQSSSYGNYYNSYKNRYTAPTTNWWEKYTVEPDLPIKAISEYVTPSDYTIRSYFTYTNQMLDSKAYDLIKTLSRFFYNKAMSYSQEINESHPYTSEFLPLLDIAKDLDIKGVTPLQKAVNFYDSLQEEHKYLDVEKMVKKLQKDGLTYKIHDELYWDSDLNDLLAEKKYYDPSKYNILRKISLFQQFGAKFKVEKEVKTEATFNSKYHRPNPLLEYSMLHHLTPYQMLLPDFDLKVATKGLIVNQPIKKVESKQIIIMLIDNSGSMDRGEKVKTVNALVLDRLRYVMKEQCELYIGYFLHHPNSLSLKHVYNRETALDFWRKFNYNPSGGDTALGQYVEKISRDIREKSQIGNHYVDFTHDKPEILAIGDGQDTAKASELNYKTNVISLFDCDNTQVKDLCIASGGKYVFLKNDMTVKQYE